MRFVVYRPLSGPWARIMILTPGEEIPETVGEGILGVIDLGEWRGNDTAERTAEAIAKALTLTTPYTHIEWEWSR